MIKYASNDVLSLSQLRLKLIAKAGSETLYEYDSSEAVSCLRVLKHHTVVSVPSYNRGRVIGRGGCNIAAIERDTGAYVYGKEEGFLILASSKAVMDRCAFVVIAAAAPRSYNYYDSE